MQTAPASRPVAGRSAGRSGVFGGGFSKRTFAKFSWPVVSSREERKPGVRAGRNQPGVGHAPSTVASPYSRDDRQALLILLAPFFFVAFSLASQQMLRTLSMPRSPEIALPSRPLEFSAPTVTEVRPAILSRVRPSPSVPMAPAAHPEMVPEIVPEILPEMARGVMQHATRVRPAPLPPHPRLAMPDVPPIVFPEPAISPQAPVASADPLTSRAVAASPATPVAADQKTASLDTAVRPDLHVDLHPDFRRPAARVVPRPQAPAQSTCAAPAALFGGVTAARPWPSRQPGDFGRALAIAAQQQLSDLVIYNARYARIAYPMGDVPGLYGVCTDVVVRAYRALGIDLQELIYTTKTGRGDRHIDHRRVDIVRKFLEKYGQSLAISEFAEDYRPGDIVTYYRPQNRTSTTHIAIVSDKLAPSGRLMIVHNRGWGPQLEDALFVDKITGHYRYSGLATNTAADPAAPLAANDRAPHSAFSRADRESAPANRTPLIFTGPMFTAAMSRPRDSDAGDHPLLLAKRNARAGLCLPVHIGQPRDRELHPDREQLREAARPAPPNGRKQRVAATRTASIAPANH